MTRMNMVMALMITLIGACTNGANMTPCKSGMERVAMGALTLGMTELQGCVPEITGSFKTACLSANQGLAPAQSDVGDRYRRIGVLSYRYPPPSDYSNAYIRAYMWYSLAASNGDGYGAKRRRSLAEEMTPDQISEAERLVAEWQPDPVECEADRAPPAS